MQAKYIGDPRNPEEQKSLPDEYRAFGVTFERDKFVDVPDDKASKFVGNSHFETKGKPPATAEAPPPVVQVAPTVMPA